MSCNTVLSFVFIYEQGLTLLLEYSSSAHSPAQQQTKERCPMSKLDHCQGPAALMYTSRSTVAIKGPGYMQDWKCDQQHGEALPQPRQRSTQWAACSCRLRPPRSSILAFGFGQLLYHARKLDRLIGAFPFTTAHFKRMNLYATGKIRGLAYSATLAAQDN